MFYQTSLTGDISPIISKKELKMQSVYIFKNSPFGEIIKKIEMLNNFYMFFVRFY